MKSKEETARLVAGNPKNQLLCTLFDFKTSSPSIIDADSLQAARFNRGRPAIFTEIIIA